MKTRNELQNLADQKGLAVTVEGGLTRNFVIDFGSGAETFVNFEDAVDAIRQYAA